VPALVDELRRQARLSKQKMRSSDLMRSRSLMRENGGLYWCYHCYGLNRAPSGPCNRCGRPIEGPPGLSYDQRLMWTLGHPDGDRAVTAARILGSLRSRDASPALRAAVIADRDPFLAVEALRSLITIDGVERLRPWLEELAAQAPFMVRAVAQRALLSTR
jgi:hypothetical protein